MKKSKDSRMLTEVELELMSILWDLGRGTVAEVIAELPRDRDLAYTSVSTILRILEQKGVLEAVKMGRGHSYVPLLKRTEYEAKAVRNVVDKVFSGTPVALVKQLLDTVDLDEAALAEIRDLISNAGRKK